MWCKEREQKILGCFSNTQEIYAYALIYRKSFQFSKSFITIMNSGKPKASNVVA